jgi:hypothetical protein
MEKMKEFRGGFTSKTLLAILIPVAVAAMLVWFGLTYIPVFPGPENQIFKIVFGFVPIGFGAIILIISLWAMIDSMMVKIVITPEFIIAEKGRRKMKSNWQTLAFSPPHQGKQLRTFSVGDGKELFWITDLFFPNFDLVVKLISTAKKAAMKKGFEV